MRAVVPSLAGWQSFPRAFANLLAFGLTALLAEWMVHQVEYAIVYGNRFDAVMGQAPHRLYMTTLGTLLTSLLLGLLSIVALWLCRASTRRRRLVRCLPDRLARHVPNASHQLTARSLLATGLVLAGCQTALYFVQENLEGLAAFGGIPGLSVLLAPQHATVLPLHLVAALCSSLLLYALAVALHRTRHGVLVAEVLARMVARRYTATPRRVPLHPHLPELRPLAGVPSLRSPPLPV